MLDLNYAEDSQADVDMNVVMTAAGKFIEVQGTAESDPFTGNALDELLKLARDGIQKIIDLQSRLIRS